MEGQARAMELGLAPEEAGLLLRVLTNYLSDLRMEITSTENYDLRESLKQDESTLKALIAKLERMGVSPA